MQLNWTLEKARRPTDEEGQIYEQVIQKAPDYLVAIYDGATVDPVASARDGRTRYANVPMIAVRCAGERDFVSRPLTDEDVSRYPRAMAAYKHATATNTNRINPALLPGITPADLAELSLMGIDDANALLTLDNLPAHLEPFRTLTKRLASLMKPRMRLIDGQLQEVAA